MSALSGLWRSARRWATALLAAATAAMAAYLLGRRDGAATAAAHEALRQRARRAERDAAAAKTAADHTEIRHEVENQSAALPDAGAQRVGDADPASAAGRLRDDGWVR